MRKQKTKDLLRLFGLVLLVIALVFTMVACNPTDDGNDDNGDDNKEVITPVRNGSFEYFTGSSFPKAPSNWTFTSEYSIDSKDDAIYNYRGVIDTSSFDAEKYHISTNPGKVGDDDYVLMLNNAKFYTSAYYSSAVTIEKDKFYKLTINVKTANLAEDSEGAYIYVSNGSSTTKNYLAKFANVVANDWTAYTSYIEASKASNTSVYVKLALGTGDEDSDTLAKGQAFFDEITLEEITEDAYTTATTKEKLDADKTIAKYDLSLPNAEFNNTSSSSAATTATPYNWYTKRGADDNGDNEAPTTGRSRGIIDITTYKATQSTGALKGVDVKTFGTPVESVGTNVLMLYLYQENNPTAHAYYSDAITFESEKQYKLTFWMLTYGIKDVNGQDAPNKGVTVKLGDNTLFENQNTNGEWVQYVIYVDGSVTQDKAQALYFWLGTGHEADKSNYVSGAAFFDCLNIEEVAQSDYDNAISTNVVEKVDYSTENLLDNLLSGNAFDSNNGAPSFWNGKINPDVATPALGKETVMKAIDLDNYPTDDTVYGVANPDDGSTERIGSNKALVIYNKVNTAYLANFTENLTINANSAYRLSFWVKTCNLTSGKGLSFKLLDLGEDGVYSDADDSDDSIISTISTVNTETTSKDDDGKEVTTNTWTEIVFYVNGSETKSNTVALTVTFGDGTIYEPDNLLSGTVFLRNMFFETLTYGEFNLASSSTYVAKHSFASTATSSVTNGNFNLIDADKSEGLVNGEMFNTPGAPSSWSGAYGEDADKSVQVVSGIVNEKVFNNLAQDNAGTVGGVNAFPYADGVIDPASQFNGEPNLLMIWNKGTTTYGYTSSTKTLTASSYYKIMVNVKTHVLDTATGATITMVNGNTTTVFENVNTNGEWVAYTFYVQVGLNSSNVKLTLSLGSDNGAEGVAFFDNVWYSTASEETYNDASETATVKKISLLTDSFETTSEDDVASPANYKGAVVSGAPSGDKYVYAGVLNLNHFNEEVEKDFGFDTWTTPIPDPVSGNEYLVIYTMGTENEGKGTAYAYTSSNYTFKADGYYRISVFARVAKLGANDKAIVKLSLSDTDTASFAVTEEEWKEYTFFVKMDDKDLTAVNLKLALGEYNKDDNDKVITDDYAVGYAFFDDVTIEKITEDDYTAGTETLDSYTKKIDVVANAEEIVGDDDDKEEENTGLSSGEIITIVSASILSIALIAVLIIVWVKKIAPKMKDKKRNRYKKPGYDKRNSKVTSKDDLDKFKD